MGFDWDAFYNQERNDPQAWLAVAAALQLSALTLWPSIAPDAQRLTEAIETWKGSGDPSGFSRAMGAAERIGVYEMLSALAIENVTKGILMLRGQLQFSHRLRDLVENLVKLPNLTTDDLDLLTVLEHRLVWSGRYPVATSAAKMRLAARPAINTYPRSIENLFERLRTQLWSEMNAAHCTDATRVDAAAVLGGATGGAAAVTNANPRGIT